MKKTSSMVVVLIILVMVYFVFSNSASETASDINDELIEPEQLISKEEVTQLICEAVADEKKTEQEVIDQKIAIYVAKDENSSKFIQTSLSQQACMLNTGITPKEVYQTTVDAFVGEEVEGIGDEAIIATPGLHILTDGYYICIGIGNFDNEEIFVLFLKRQVQ